MPVAVSARSSMASPRRRCILSLSASPLPAQFQIHIRSFPESLFCACSCSHQLFCCFRLSPDQRVDIVKLLVLGTGFWRVIWWFLGGLQSSSFPSVTPISVVALPIAVGVSLELHSSVR
ncbi:hypothetical protein Bca52824_015195 [Brassica carinata]|uniref:Uncharacterized protein n=1 Tax=Brassica carinata TaxID=52824 RepID=A0A8X8B559_BRACI|nr:hypothetical protein Bca52824_015195 [Brassica carinata]